MTLPFFTHTDFEALAGPARRDAVYLHRPFLLDENNDTSLSHLGGLPSLPVNIDWPRDSYERAMHFLAQIDCASLPKISFNLPNAGLLLFFGCLDDEDCWQAPNSVRVIHVLDTHHEKHKPPDDLLPLFPHGHQRYRTLEMPDDAPVKVFRHWPVQLYRVDDWPTHVQGCDWQELTDRKYDDMRERMIAAELFRVTGTAPNFTDKYPHWRYRCPRDLDDGPPFPQVWGMIDKIARAFCYHSDRSDKDLISQDDLQAKAVTRAHAFIKQARRIASNHIPTVRDSTYFLDWLRPLISSDNDAVQHLIKDAVSDGMRMALEEMAIDPVGRANVPADYFQEASWHYLPTTAHLDATLRPRFRADYSHHKMLGYRRMGGADPDFDNDDNVMLLQLFSDDALQFCFYDHGFAEFWISKKDLADRRFDKAFGFIDG
ncbi:DUF1963 domain-containing protein [Parasulfitobacter algicola]|uniref:DUF1963 domain-containing protein n=1 Tax=Parasulfitobacter algicola TaxID=2614809 RepID=A0ABX2ITW6_9RHOB|nr:DUF1963 domain-containing protein [Sulfitobacter algicola]NSX55451.1 DUF1963 domain-containing protein [Sulfitobacter algicola]